MTMELAAATRAGIGTGPAPIINRGSSGRILSSGAIFLGVEMYTNFATYLDTTPSVLERIPFKHRSFSDLIDEPFEPNGF